MLIYEVYIIAGVCTDTHELMILILITDAHRFWRTTMFNDMVIRRITMFFPLILHTVIGAGKGLCSDSVLVLHTCTPHLSKRKQK